MKTNKQKKGAAMIKLYIIEGIKVFCLPSFAHLMRMSGARVITI